jgi:hypothetical protein
MNRLHCFGRMICLCLLLLFNLKSAAAQQVKLEGVPFQQVLDQLFGTTANAGLLAGKQRFELRAEDVTLTSDQARNFLVPSSANNADIADLVSAARQIRGAQVKIEGLADGTPFEFKLAGREVKLEGLNLTQAELDSLVQQLKGITELREVKIESLVDGKPMEVKIENRAGRVKVEDREGQNHDRERHDKEALHDADDDHVREHASTRIERPEKNEKIERVDKVERIERPEIEHGGTGRH